MRRDTVEWLTPSRAAAPRIDPLPLPRQRSIDYSAKFYLLIIALS